MHLTTKVSEEVNRKCRPKNTMMQLSTPYTDPSATVHSCTDRRTDMDRQTDGETTVAYDANS